MSTPTFNALRAKYGGLIRDRAADDPELIDTKHAMQAEALVAAVEKAMAKAPPMTDEIRHRIVALLHEPAAGDEGGSPEPSNQTEKEGSMTDTPTHEIHNHIRSWLQRNEVEFEEAVKAREAERAKYLDKLKDSLHDIPDSVEAMLEHRDLGDHQRNQMPIGMFLEVIDSRRRDGNTATVYQLFQVAKAGVDMLYRAIAVADAEDNAEFFLNAFDEWGSLVTTALEEMGLPNRNTITGVTR